MNQTSHSSLVSFIWRIADDCLRDVYVRGKYRDVILPMVVLRRLDTLLEPTKDAVLEEVRYQKEDIGATELDDEPLKDASGYVFFNTSHWTLKKLYNTATNNQQILLANIEDYLDGFSDNVKEIIGRFNLFEQMSHMAEKQVLLDVIEKFVSPWVNLTPNDIEDPEGNTLPGLSNLGMGYVFEELIRKFNEENNEEAGEHFTPREVIHRAEDDAAQGRSSLHPARGDPPHDAPAFRPDKGPSAPDPDDLRSGLWVGRHADRGSELYHGRRWPFPCPRGRLPLWQRDQRRNLRDLQIRHDDQGQ
ncbi:type I DNA methyltransferase M subunit HsdM [Gluconobacter thailandicus F149-1 = NBRC 100600]|uniref:site-specific DNA-methyltransferase (adenine-specific) n=1 Tax=Gluconobacter thailandicus NBRC 3257 TaxID=1381097 RepID=A0ABQ0ISX5_GLUTH|nr:hypothetical protein NBRC3257_0259 [Gluconobacter thailandicus NBRC 3257]GAN92807.1 type I DNA methyltransferase M subunit HsdM [Gluconobacter thailandicus F149-1 = NBRC 100600]GEL88221.1 hypothetical protein GTH01_25790 [Gluconobacter thailandicus F149-1 = NBRC 100600]